MTASIVSIPHCAMTPGIALPICLLAAETDEREQKRQRQRVLRGGQLYCSGKPWHAPSSAVVHGGHCAKGASSPGRDLYLAMSTGKYVQLVRSTGT